MNEVTAVLDQIKSQPRLIDQRYNMRDLKPVSFEAGEVDLLRRGADKLSLHENAMSQYFSMLGYPANEKFNERIAFETRNAVLRELHKACGEKEILLRKNIDNEVIALLSDKYRPFDNHEVAEQVSGALEALKPPFDVQSAPIVDVGENKMRVLITFPNVSVSAPDRKRVSLGIDISNDETGRGSVRLTPAMYRFICSNGMVSCEKGEELRSYHTKSNQTIGLGIQNMVFNIREFLYSWEKAAWAASNESIPAFNDTKDFQAYLGKTEVTKKDAEGIQQALSARTQVEEVQPSIYQLAQAITFYAAAQGKRRQQLERLGHAVMTRSW